MPIIRRQVAAFIRNWNAHYIRVQTQRSESKAGVPNLLYYWPDKGVPTGGHKPDETILAAVKGDLAGWGKYTSKGKVQTLTISI